MLDENGDLHADDGPAASWADGYCVRAWHGDPFSEQLGKRRLPLDAAAAIAEPNLELRRQLLESIGPERLLEDLSGVLVDRDPSGSLWHIPIGDDEPLALVYATPTTRMETVSGGPRQRPVP